MDADEIRRQGKEFADKLRHGAGEQVSQHEDKIKETIGKVVDFVNAKTDGRYSEQIGKAASFVEHGVDRLAAEGRPAESPKATSSTEGTPGPDATPPGTPTTDAPGSGHTADSSGHTADSSGDTAHGSGDTTHGSGDTAHGSEGTATGGDAPAAG